MTDENGTTKRRCVERGHKWRQTIPGVFGGQVCARRGREATRIDPKFTTWVAAVVSRVTDEKAQPCDVAGCDHPAVILLANDAPLLSADYREWYACRCHQRNVTIPADDLAFPPEQS